MIYVGRKSEIDLVEFDNPTFRDTVSKAQDRSIWPGINLLDRQFGNLNKLVSLASAIAVVSAFDWRFALLICVALIPEFLVDVRHGKAVWSIFDGEVEDRRRYGEANHHFMVRSNLIELRLFQNVPAFADRIRGILDRFRNSQEVAERKRHMLQALTTSLGIGAMVATIVMIALRVVSGEAELSTFVFVWGSVTGLHGTFKELLSSIAQQNEWSLYVGEIYAVMEGKKESAVRTGTIAIPRGRVPRIEFRNVSFSYPWSPGGREILKDVSFTLEPGEKSALVGINGAGKTTLVKLLCGIYDPTKGEILIDGVSLRDVSLDSWRAQLTVLFQNYTTYHARLKEIISFGDTSVPLDEARVIEAAKAAGVDSFVPDLPQGYDTMIGRDFEGGIELSGGQGQRLAIARAWYRRGNVVVLDEPTASLDAFAEEQIFSEIESREKGETIILITHRMSSVRNAEHIIVIDQGVVAEQGDHEALMKKDGVYAEMFKSQAKGYRTTAE
jgi:ATP-binding cassette subfamily B protein